MHRKPNLMRLLLATALTCTMAVPALAGFGGSDNFDSNATSEHSSFGGSTGYGNTANSRGSSCQCNDNYSIDQLGQVDRIGPGGSHRIETYERGRLVGISSDPGPSWDETTGRYFREQPQPQETPAPHRPEPKPITRADMLVSAEPAITYQEFAPPAPELPAKLEDQEPEQVREALNYMQRSVREVKGPPTKSERSLSKVLGMAVGTVTGWASGGFGKSEHMLSRRSAGALAGAGTAKMSGVLERKARDIMNLSPKEMSTIEDRVSKMDSRDQDRLVDRMRDAIREQRAIERDQSRRDHKANEGGKRR